MFQPFYFGPLLRWKGWICGGICARVNGEGKETERSVKQTKTTTPNSK